MGKSTGFIEIPRKKMAVRPVDERLHDWREVTLPYVSGEIREQGARCMDCGIPFCHSGCPLGNLIPDWNDLVYRDRWHSALDRLLATNNFPEFTGRLCPAPCEGACVVGINRAPVAIKGVEVSIIERGFEEGWLEPQPPVARTWRKVAVVGSGPAGLAAAEQLNRVGHTVTVFEKADRIGGLLRYGIPEFKMEKQVLDRRLSLMEAEGVVFRPGMNVGADLSVDDLLGGFDAVLLSGGAGDPRDLAVPGRELSGIHFAMDYLTQQNRRCEGDVVADAEVLSARDCDVVIIGGGDTGADCLGTVLRQGCRSVHQFELLPRPPDVRAADNPWPLWPNVFRVSSAHEEGGERVYAVSTERFLVDNRGHVRALQAVRVEMVRRDGRIAFDRLPGTEFELEVDLVLLAMGFTGPRRDALLEGLGVRMTERGTVWRDANWMTSVPKVFTAGDMQRGQSLIVWAIAEGRSAARGIDAFLMGSSRLPAPLA
jgi:glutamate synthase (NADPH/NADH) small chain